MRPRTLRHRAAVVTVAAVALSVAGALAGVSPAPAAPSAATATAATTSAAKAVVQPSASGCPGGATIACYPMDERLNRQYDLIEKLDPADNNVVGALDPATASGVVADRNATTYSFSGWNGFIRKAAGRWALAPSPVTGATTFADTYGEVLVDRTGIADPATSFNPGLRDWRVRVRLEPQLLVNNDGSYEMPDACVGATCGELTHPSYNVVQKGRNATGGAIGGFYKIEVMGYTANDHGLPFVKGSVHCVFTDDDGTSVEAFTGVGSRPLLLDYPSYYTVDCQRVGSTVRLKVTNEALGTTQRVDGTMTILGRKSTAYPLGDGVLDDVSPANVAGTVFSSYLGIGKKPFSTNPGDAFRGWIDYLSLSTP